MGRPVKTLYEQWLEQFKNCKGCEDRRHIMREGMRLLMDPAMMRNPALLTRKLNQLVNLKKNKDA